MIIDNVKYWIYRLFGRRVTDKQITESTEDVRKYTDISKSNYTAIFANALSVLAFSDSSISVTAEDGASNLRSELLDDVAKRCWSNIKQNIAVGLGCGMIASIPYAATVNGKRKIFVDTVAKDRFFVTDYRGDEIVKCTAISDYYNDGNANHYLRWTDYEVIDGVYTIRQKVTKNGSPAMLTDVEMWADIPEEIRIGNVEKLPLGVFTCPTSNRRPKKIDGVPITYGCDSKIEEIDKLMIDLQEEFKNKGLLIFADESLFDKNDKLTKIYKKLKFGGSKLADGKAALDVFDPAFRETAYYTRLEHLFSELEKEVGTSKGILTDANVSNGATATEVRRAQYNTFALCDDIHRNTERYFNDLMYGVNVLAEYYGLTPPGDFTVVYNWSYAMLEDTNSTFNQLMQARSVGAVDTAEIRQFVIAGETLDEAREKIEEIKANNPTISQLVGE